MGKTRAEIQKSYRERKKADKTWVQKERERRMKYYIPASQLPQDKLEKQRKKVREGMRKTRANRREALVTESTSAVTQQSPHVENNEAGEGASTTTQKPVTRYVI